MKQFKLTFLLTVLMSMAGINAFAYHCKVDGICYNVNSNNLTAIVTYSGWPYNNDYTGHYGGSGLEGLNIQIPSTILYNDVEYTVIAIGDYAFYDCESSILMASISIPSTITCIGNYAFYECSSLTSVTIPNNVTSIGTCAFYNCRGLTSIAIPNSVTSIGNSAFGGCSNLTSVVSKITIPFIFGSYAFDNIGSNCTLTVPSGTKAAYIAAGWTEDVFKGGIMESSSNISFADSNVKAICVAKWDKNGDGELSEAEAAAVNDVGTVFKNNTTITSFNELQYFTGLTNIATSAFNQCSNLTSIVIPNNITSIGIMAFDSCYKLYSITIPDNVNTIGKYAFYGCGLHSLEIGEGLKTIEDNAFEYCNALTSITVDGGNTTYDSRNNCNALIVTQSNTLLLGCKNTIIPNTIEKIGLQAFCQIGELTSIDIPNSVIEIGNTAFNGCKNLESAAIGNGVISIGNWAFSDCPALTTINIPDNVKTIGASAFAGDTGLSSISLGNGLESIGEYAFYGCNSLNTVTVDSSFPIAITENVFSNRANATLYIPYGCKSAYEKAAFWKEFKEIIEMANTGDPTANTLSLSAIQGNRGKQVVLPVALNNQHQITGLQMDLYLPAGVTIAKKANGKMMISTTDRMDGNYTLTGEAMDGFVRILGYSGDSDAFTGTSGDILNITLDLNSEMNAGEYTIQLKDIVLSDVNNTEYHPANAEAKLTVKSYTLGDVDDSGAININDVVCIINHILNRSNGTFIPEAADVDENGTININDVVTLINRYILMRDNAPAYNNGSSRASMAESNYLHLDNIAIKPGETKEITMLLSNSNEVRAIQGNIKLPAGLSFVNKSNGRPDVKNIDARSEDFTLSCAVQDDGSMTFAQYSADGFSYTGNDGGIFTFKIKAADSATAGSYTVDLKGVVLSIDGVGYDIPDRSSSIVVTGTDGISEIKTTEPVDVYTLDGRKIRSKASDMSELPNGVYIVNGKKIVVK